MTLTVPPGPLSGNPAPTNYAIDGPQHRLMLVDFPRRVRGELGGETVVDTTAAKLVHETGMRPQLYVPLADVRADTLSRTELSTHCAFKGHASYRTITVGDRVAENALWVYDEPIASAAWLDGLAGCYLDRLDRWLDEDEEVPAFRDPYHRVDVRRTSRHVEVRAGDRLIASSDRALLLSETGVANRFYLRREDVRVPLEGPTATTSTCPYKGVAEYWTVAADGAHPAIVDAAWSYPDPWGTTIQAAGHLSFSGEAIDVVVDGAVVSS
jgi:uncharacterized protein (DUF427 family)